MSLWAKFLAWLNASRPMYTPEDAYFEAAMEHIRESRRQRAEQQAMERDIEEAIRGLK